LGSVPQQRDQIRPEREAVLPAGAVQTTAGTAQTGFVLPGGPLTVAHVPGICRALAKARADMSGEGRRTSRTGAAPHHTR
jgi:hypothetical protein